MQEQKLAEIMEESPPPGLQQPLLQPLPQPFQEPMRLIPPEDHMGTDVDSSADLKGKEYHGYRFEWHDSSSGDSVDETDLEDRVIKTASLNEQITDMKETTSVTELHREIKEDEFEVVIAIDFGTAFTGFAFSYRKSKTKIETGHRKLKKDRVPTVVLLKSSDNTVDSVGTSAEDKYARSVILKSRKNYRLFSRFKMALYKDENLSRSSTIKDNDGKPMLALELFTLVIQYMTRLATEMVKESLLFTNREKLRIKDTIQWILTIPAIWTDNARQFMHEVFRNADIPENQLRIVLEPEAAAIYTRHLLLYKSEMAGIEKLPGGTKYILADLGGGTVDICTHEIIENDNIRELFQATGGAYGGTYVDDMFTQTLVEIFGSEVWAQFQSEHYNDILQLMRHFEKDKRNFEGTDTTETEECAITVDLPNSLIKMLKNNPVKPESTQNSSSLQEKSIEILLKELIRGSSYSDDIKVLGGDKLIIKSAIMEDYFSRSVVGIISSLTRIIEECPNDDVNTLILVEGYAESPYVTKQIQHAMGNFNVRVIIVPKPRLSVMKGAVMLGYEDRSIIQRKSRVTYGFAVARSFIEGVHPEQYKFERDGEYFCDRIFDKLIEKDQYVEYGQKFITRTSTSRRHQESKTENVHITVVTSEKCDPTYCSEEEECKEVGEIIIEPPEEGWPDENEKEMYLIVQEDIMICKVIDKTCGGKEYTTQVNFLSKSLKF
ncbi:heat shock 70 kDa protein 12A-like [Mercenaria mercenaria]|uniref:heat shock 70 kDa protein 12A-like n=1 Tax=Mercenaria mercenaria TaxID=6596 RepID=UPI00234F1864|nr:heat shock 70 kDa protein 12A-like [Mercenaria mercenaria]